jgi:hypothetical protein
MKKSITILKKKIKITDIFQCVKGSTPQGH